MTTLCSISVTAILLLTSAEQSSLLSVRKYCDQLESCYSSDDLTDLEIARFHKGLEKRIFEGLRKSSPDKIVGVIDFTRSFEAYVILGSILSFKTRGEKPYSGNQKDQFCISLYDRCIADRVFRQQFTRYVVWSNILRTTVSDQATYFEFVSLLAKYTRSSPTSDEMPISALMFVVYAELFGIFDDYSWAKWEDALDQEFATTLSNYKDIQMRIIEGKWQRFQGYKYRKRNEDERSNRYNPVIEGEEKVVERLADHSDSFLPLLPFDECSHSLVRFLEYDALNVSFRIDRWR